MPSRPPKGFCWARKEWGVANATSSAAASASLHFIPLLYLLSGRARKEFECRNLTPARGSPSCGPQSPEHVVIPFIPLRTKIEKNLKLHPYRLRLRSSVSQFKTRLIRVGAASAGFKGIIRNRRASGETP